MQNFKMDNVETAKFCVGCGKSFGAVTSKKQKANRTIVVAAILVVGVVILGVGLAAQFTLNQDSPLVDITNPPAFSTSTSNKSTSESYKEGNEPKTVKSVRVKTAPDPKWNWKSMSDFSEGFAAIQDSLTENWGFIDMKGNVIIIPEWNHYSSSIFVGSIDPNNGLKHVRLNEDDTTVYTLLNGKNDVLISPNLEGLTNFVNGEAFYKEDGMWGKFELVYAE